MKRRVKRTRSPRHADEPPSHRAAGIRRIRRGPDRRNASTARRIAELEVEVDELRGKMAALETVVGVDLHDCDEVRALQAAQHRNGGGSGFGLLHVQHESGHRVSNALLVVVRTETKKLTQTIFKRVNDTVFARWTISHAVVPSLVAEHVVAPFADLDWIVSGPGAPGSTVLGAEPVRDASRRIDTLVEAACGTPLPGGMLLDDRCQSACSRLSSDDSLRQFMAIVTPFVDRWPGLALLRSWCAFRLSTAGDAAAAAGRIIVNASHATDWREALACHKPDSQIVLMQLAALAASPDNVVPLCKLLPSYSESHGSMIHTGSRAASIPWSTEFFANFFCCLAPHATTAEAVTCLCRACFCHRPSEAAVDWELVQRFFVALVPGITTTQAFDAVALALSKIVCTFASSQHYPFPPDFYREFVLPLARRASCSGIVRLVCEVFVFTFSESWEVAEDLPEILTKFLRILMAEGKSQKDLLEFTSVLKRIACCLRTVELLSDVAETVVLPLVPSTRHDKCNAARLLSVLEAIVAYRSRKGDASMQQELEQAMQDLRRHNDSRVPYGHVRTYM